MPSTRDYLIRWGDYEMTGPPRNLDGKIRFDSGFERATCEFEFVIASASSINLDTEHEDAEQAFRSLNQDFVATIGGNSIIDWSPSTGTAVETSATLRKIGDQWDGKRSRKYIVSIEAQLPADTNERKGRRPHAIEIEFDPDRIRSVTISGDWTIDPDENGATDAFLAGIDSLVEDVLDEIDATVEWELASETRQANEIDTVVSYRRTYRETTTAVEITYNGFTVGGSSDRRIDGAIRHTRTDDEISISADVLVAATTANELAAAGRELEEAWRAPRGDLRIRFGTTTVFDGTQAEGTCLDARANAERSGDPVHAGLNSRRYTVSVTAGLPADYLGLQGRRSSTVEIEYSASRRKTLTVSAVYTATENDPLASENAASRFAGYANLVADAIGGEWELVSEDSRREETDKTITVTRRLIALLWTDKPHAAVREQDFQFTLHDEWPALGRGQASAGGQSVVVGSGNLTAADMFRQRRLEVQYSASVDSTVVTTIADLEEVLETTRLWVSSQVPGIGVIKDAASKTLMQETANANRHSWRIELTQSWEIIDNDNTWRRYTQRVKMQSQSGLTLVPAWGGSPYHRFGYQGPATMKAIITEEGIFVGSAFNLGVPPAPNVGGLTAGRMDNDRDVLRQWVGESARRETEIRQVTTYDYYIQLT